MPKKLKDVVTIDNESDEELDEEVEMEEGDTEEEDVEVEDEEGDEDEEEEEEEEEDDEDNGPFSDLANPHKKLPNSSKTPMTPGGGPPQQASPVSQRPFIPPVTDPNVPSPGYTSIDEEKADLLFKLDRLRRKGMTVRSMDFTHDIREIRLEAARIRNELELDSSLAFSKKMLMAVVSTMEFLNKRYDPFDLALDGWGEHVMEGIDSYDNVLEKLYYKYRGRASMPPEMELLLSLAGSAFMFHMTNSMFKKLTQGPAGGGNNPDLLKSMMSAFGGMAKQQQQPPPASPPPQHYPPPQSPRSPAENYEMKGPSIDLGPFMNMMGGGGGGGGGGGMMPPMMGMMGGGGGGVPPMMGMMAPPQPSRAMQHQPEAPPVYQPPTTSVVERPRGGEFLPEPSPIVKTTTIHQVASAPSKKVMQREYDDRLSDIISEDLESLSSGGISQLSSPSLSGSIKNLVINETKKRGRPKKNAENQGKVLQI